ncbi:HNH endonuclease [Stutzerimonas stutzeri]|uniref:HNH endonuclease n=1 Tax=Stutzerimonas stutzeri TaxID=316 RepID=UPI001BCB3DAB
MFPASKLPVEIRSKYPDGVPFTSKGFPDFSRYSASKVQITPQSTRAGDFKLANQTVGYRSTPKGYTWHHTEKSGEMILVPSDIHRAVAHTGGVAVGK